MLLISWPNFAFQLMFLLLVFWRDNFATGAFAFFTFHTQFCGWCWQGKTFTVYAFDIIIAVVLLYILSSFKAPLFYKEKIGSCSSNSPLKWLHMNALSIIKSLLLNIRFEFSINKQVLSFNGRILWQGCKKLLYLSSVFLINSPRGRPMLMDLMFLEGVTVICYDNTCIWMSIFFC